ncbi:MAG: DUF3592 domain-containing protein [Gemmatimonadota bacterium]|nr:DUF3592 domain-containing protein [Gemmatimonadota bacterium]
MYGLLALILAILGGGILVTGLMLARRALAARRWPETPGRVTAVSIAIVWLGRGSLHFPDVQYEYQVGDERLLGTRLGFAARIPWISRGAALYALQHEYPRGRVVAVRYNPSDSTDAVLEPGIRAGLCMLIGTGALLIAIAVAALIASRILEIPST